jgi:hypothetical protein
MEMPERRMFAKTIIDSDAFLDMPMSTQALYFHLSMRADDEGFINNPRKIVRMIGASEDDLKLLIAKSFILVFETGVVVIKHWKIHNYIQNDRFKPTVYQEERSQLSIKKNGTYTFDESLDTECIQDVSKAETQVRLGKVRLNNIYNKSSNEDLSCLTASKNDENGHKKVDYQQIADLYNTICKSFPRCTTLSEKRKKAINARLKTYSVDDIKRCFEKAEQSNFLKGGNNRNWSANFDWLMSDSNMAKVLDGNYDNREKGGVNGNTNNHREGNTETYDEWNNLVENIYNECKPK